MIKDPWRHDTILDAIPFIFVFLFVMIPLANANYILHMARKSAGEELILEEAYPGLSSVNAMIA